MAILNNLYPGIVDTFMPAFLIDSGNPDKDTCKIYFSLSDYNTLSEITNAQVTVSNQNTNVSVLNKEKYPCHIMLTTIYEDVSRTSSDRFYIKINKTDIEENEFKINTYYKVQFRFTGVNASSVSLDTPQAIDSWLTSNLSCFSEWSRVCIIRGISTPILNIKNVDTTAALTLFSTTNIDIVGSLSFNNPEESETLKSYNIKLYKYSQEEEKNLILDSGEVYTSNYMNVNEINYTLKYLFQDGEKYYLSIDYTTKNLYQDNLSFDFMIMEVSLEKIDADISIEEQPENGRIKLSVIGPEESTFTGNITVRRTSSRSKFTIWEDVSTTSFAGERLNYIWYDYTIESGVWYKYGVQKRDSFGNRGIMTILKEPKMIVFEDIFLNANGKQLKIKFNPQISSFQRTKSESKIDTTGGKYPIITRNGYTDYKQFPLSGLISCFMDDNNIFTSKQEIYEGVSGLYEDYNKDNRISEYEDINYEKEFREKVMDFLYENNIKLFRSPTEGNLMVKLMDITFTPNINLGRQLYTFNCNVYEMEEFNLENCNKENIQLLGELNNNLEYTKDFIGQLNQLVPANQNAITIINQMYQNKSQEMGASIEYLDYFKFVAESEPYLIIEGQAGPVPIQRNVNDTQQNLQNAILGYIININNKDIVVGPEGIYELDGKDLQITSIIFPVDTEVSLDYHVLLRESEQDASQIIRSSTYFTKVGQLWGRFNFRDLIYMKIWNKYYEKTDSYLQTVYSIDDISIEADEGTVVYVKETDERDFQRHIIGDTGRLDFMNDESAIEDLYFAGIHMLEANNLDTQKIELPYNKFVYNNTINYNNFTDIVSPIKNNVYKVNNVNYIFYNNNFYEFLTESQDVKCPVQAMVDYYCEISKGRYD